MKEVVVLVHGVWSNGIDLWRLRSRLNQAGYECYMFNYHVWQAPPADLAEKLHAKLEKIDADIIHFVGHSFGGIILMHLFDRYPASTHRGQVRADGRIVLLGSPVNGSAVGKRLSKTRATKWMLGHSADGLYGDIPEWRGWQDIGVLAGTMPLGVGMLAGGPVDSPHDGTVAVEETRLKGATDFVSLPVSHTGMLISTEVASYVITFLRSGRFDDDTRTPLLDGVV